MDNGMIRVIQSCPTWLPQTQTWLYNQAKHTPDFIEQHIVCEMTENLDQFGLQTIHCLEDINWTKAKWEKLLRNLYIRPGASFLSQIAKRIGADVIHSHFGNIGWHNQRAIRSLNTKHIVTYYGYDVNMLPTHNKKWLHRYIELFDQADGFLCEGSFMAKELVRLGCPDRKITIQHLGVEVDNIPFVPRKWDPGEPLHILIAASFTEKKGIPYALEAIADFRAKQQVLITVIGDVNPKSVDKSEKKKILSTIKNRNLCDCTRLLGFQPYSELFNESYKHHVFISPSVRASNGDTEGGAPISLIDMMATGIPIVSTNHCDIPEVVKYGMDEWLAKERDVAGLVERLEWLVNNYSEWSKISSIGRKHVELEYNATTQGSRLGAIYRNLG